MVERAIRRVEDLMVFRRAYRLSLAVHRASLEFPRIEQFALADQVRRASKSICANFAEGFAKQSYSAAEYRRYLLMALGSSDEVQLWLRYCIDLEYVAELTGGNGSTAMSRSAGCCAVSTRAGPLPPDPRLLPPGSRLLVPERGSGAFRRPVKVRREACWRYRKREC
jgi:four helix bundle protein